jgi:hypothetical protein
MNWLRVCLICTALTLMPPAPTQAAHDMTLSWAQPYGYAVLWWGLSPDDACAVRVKPLPEVVLRCGSNRTTILSENNPDATKRAIPGMVVVLRSPTFGELARATLIPKVSLPFVVAP